ncbi:hypothetical protein LPJ66_003086 [Kickxella alabastrina]|uniref:Uncharacterized protein n=1 Tax=Kickxella alabastrina TaxID=61397 RepID=A0ACC1ING2_9FUNG|nr:hypothetical protein LPJ66_003086 [Kickxella alabastrina]
MNGALLPQQSGYQQRRHFLGKHRRLILLCVCALVIFITFYNCKIERNSGMVDISRESSTTLRLSTKTPYPHPHPDLHLHISPNRSNSSQPLGQLTLIQLQLISRHGARYPTLSGMLSINRTHEKLRPYISQAWIKPELADEALDGILSTNGEIEVRKIALRMTQKYNVFLDKHMQRKGAIRFVSSEWQRSRESANAFRRAMDPNNTTEPVVVVPAAEDTTLAMRFTCPLWGRSKKSNARSVAQEIAVFDDIHGDELQKRILQKLAKLAKRPVVPLTMSEIKTIYSLCGYDQSLYSESAHWCSLFDTRTTELLELCSDIRYSRVYGPYGPPINKRIACSLLTQITKDINQALLDPLAATSTFRFAHAETIMFISTILELESVLGVGSVPIVGNMTEGDARRRGFRTTNLVPFSSNIMLELYKDQSSQPFFRLLLNERAVNFPACSADGLCPLSVLRNMLAGNIGCDYAQMCTVDDKYDDDEDNDDADSIKTSLG